ncbi:xanthine dehydrogenase accessory protein XdhC [Litchfieldella qijiaojingensis]|uniref:Xanthine dehydrogenase accessory protein XdhC n=1 Tax=Litchfieldella qijiaojingensis TaxID=980347 RepID=A0ABQ2YEW0_9GAMM|nr:xanthine dehydrogenase accessory protein XdhC [Halomonas qijiaojingensis]GGX79926.1 xanthine dehydrogenase accessory protein XdhC [Halomonas qijiaojingensis]
MTSPETLSWHAALHRLQQEARPHALASVVGAAGSTPREPGAKMVITADDTHDTLGGGTFEFQVIAAAREALAAGEIGTRLEAFPLGGRSGQCCGGYVHVLLEIFAGAEMSVALFGAGHVGQALVGLMAPLPWRVLWFDSREDIFPEGSESQPRLSCRRMASGEDGPDIESAVTSLPAGSHVLVMTHDHGEDRRLIDALLKRGDCASIGLIGSKSKWASFQRRLRDAGHDQTSLDRVRCPIGIPGAKGKQPYEIAVAVVAELLTLKPASEQDDSRGVPPETLREVFANAPPKRSSSQP